MTVLIEMLLNVLPYVAIFIVSWVLAGALDRIHIRLDQMDNNYNKRFNALNKKTSYKK